MYKRDLLELIKKDKAVIGIVGMGYVGLPLMLSFINNGLKVIGIDIDKRKVTALSSGKSYISHIPDESIAHAIKNGFKVTTDFSAVQDLDAIIICVPTPLNKYREPDLSYIENTLTSASEFFKKGQFISLESTTYPGTTREVIQPVVASKGFTVGEDFFIGYSPEREDPGNSKYSTATIPKICSGITKSCAEVAKTLYEKIINQVVPLSSPEAAEMTKLLENIHRAVNIGLVNEMKMVAHKMNIDIHEVIDAAATKPFGFVPYYPGPGLGGHCIPVDPFYLTWKAREFGIHTRFIELSGEINTAMPAWVVNRIAETLNLSKKSINGSKILVLGVAYKKNVDDLRESPSLDIIEILKDKGAAVEYNDPYFEKLPIMRKHKLLLSSVDISKPDVFAEYDCVVIATDHDQYDYEMIREHALKVVDTRGVYRGNYENIQKA